MIRILIAFALLSQPLAALAQSVSATPTISLEQRMLLRCSAAFALVANRQRGGEAWALEYPPLQESGREFFVRASAKVIDEAHLAEGDIEPLLRAEAEQLLDRDDLTTIMPVCLGLLGQSGL